MTSLRWLWLLALPTSFCLDVATVFRNNVWSAQTTFHVRGEPGFANVTERWTVVGAPTYSAVISPGTEKDLMKSVCMLEAFNILCSMYLLILGPLSNPQQYPVSRHWGETQREHDTSTAA